MNLPLVVLAGNPNTGKSTLFNALTGQRQQVSNFTGTTVACHAGLVTAGGRALRLVDLPGAYSLSPYSEEERLARDFILREPIDLIVNVLDAANLERNLYLTSQLLETGMPLLVVLNKLDVARRRGVTVDQARLAEMLHAPVIGTLADRGQGLDLLRGHLARVVGAPEPRPAAQPMAVAV